MLSQPGRRREASSRFPEHSLNRAPRLFKLRGRRLAHRDRTGHPRQRKRPKQLHGRIADPRRPRTLPGHHPSPSSRQTLAGLNTMKAAVMVLAIAALAGCGDDPQADRTQVESLIRSQLPQSVRRNTGKAVFVNDVTCVAKENNEFDCIANLTGTDGAGGLESFDVPIAA